MLLIKYCIEKALIEMSGEIEASQTISHNDDDTPDSQNLEKKKRKICSYNRNVL